MSGVELSHLLGRSRVPAVTLARRLSAFLIRELSGISYPAAARAMGTNSHAAIRQARGEFERRIDHKIPRAELGEFSRLAAFETYRDLYEQTVLELARRMNVRAEFIHAR
jgi:hypothetical protein